MQAVVDQIQVWQEQGVSGLRVSVNLSAHEFKDDSLVSRVIGVRDANGDAVRGTVSIDRSEQRWRFSPQKPWPREVIFSPLK